MGEKSLERVKVWSEFLDIKGKWHTPEEGREEVGGGVAVEKVQF